jgi:hypothetical protein
MKGDHPNPGRDAAIQPRGLSIPNDGSRGLIAEELPEIGE